jgi:hypothetical protein
MTSAGDRLRDALRRRDYAKAAEIAAKIEPPPAAPVGERMRRIFDEEPPANEAAPAAETEGRPPAAR